jgi:hypothetical protein
MNWAWLVPFSLPICRLIQCPPDRICSTTMLPGAASGLLAVIPPVFALEPLKVADTGGITMTSTGPLSVPSGPLSRKTAFMVRFEAVIAAVPLPPVVAVPACCQADWPASRSSRLTLAPATPPDLSERWAVNVSLRPATIRPLVTVMDRLACPVRDAGPELLGCGEGCFDGPGLGEEP